MAIEIGPPDDGAGVEIGELVGLIGNRTRPGVIPSLAVPLDELTSQGNTNRIGPVRGEAPRNGFVQTSDVTVVKLDVQG